MTIQQIPTPPTRSLPVAPEGVFTLNWYGWFTKVVNLLNSNLAAGYSGTIVTAKLTVGGTNGSLVFKNGILISETAAS